MLYPHLSEIALFSFDFAPQGWAKCNGQLMPINQNQALFSLLGTTYGGNGQTNFALPDLRGRVPIGFGGPWADYLLGNFGGSETVTLQVTDLPQHVHAIDASALTATARCRTSPANQRGPANGLPAIEAAGVTAPYSDATPDTEMRGGAVSVALSGGLSGGGEAHGNRQPSLALTYCIALQGIYPSQN